MPRYAMHVHQFHASSSTGAQISDADFRTLCRHAHRLQQSNLADTDWCFTRIKSARGLWRNQTFERTCVRLHYVAIRTESRCTICPISLLA